MSNLACQDDGRGPCGLWTYDYLKSLPHIQAGKTRWVQPQYLAVRSVSFEKKIRGFVFFVAPHLCYEKPGARPWGIFSKWQSIFVTFLA